MKRIKNKSLKRHTINEIAGFYNSWLQDRSIVEKICNFILKYRLMTWGQQSYYNKFFLVLHRRDYLISFYRTLHDQFPLKDQDKSLQQEYFDLLIENLVKSSDEIKENWNISLIADQTQRKIECRRLPILSSVLEEMDQINADVILSHAREQIANSQYIAGIPLYCAASLNWIWISPHQFKPVVKHWTQVQEQVNEAMPTSSIIKTQYNYGLPFVMIIVALLIVYKILFTNNVELWGLGGIICLVTLPKIEIFFKKMVLKSSLDYEVLPEEFQAGLVTDIRETADNIITELKSRLPQREHFEFGTYRPEHTNPAPAPAVQEPTSAQTEREYAPKAKRHSNHPHLQWSPPPPPPVYEWKTKEYGTICYKLGRGNYHLFQLRGETIKQPTVICFNRSLLEKDKHDPRRIDYFYKLVSMGHVARRKGHPGFKWVKAQEKQEWKLSADTVGKFKSLRKEHSQYRLFCIEPTLKTDKPAHGWNLYVTSRLIKTH